MTPGNRGRPGSAGRPLGGFSHVEVLVAMLIIAMATPLLLGGIMGSLARARLSRDRGAAAVWLQGEIEYLRLQCYQRLAPSARKVTPVTLQPGEPSLPAGAAAGYVLLEPAGDALLKATISLYRKDWGPPAPVARPLAETATYIGDLRVAAACP